MKVKFFSIRPYEEAYLVNANIEKHEIQFEKEALSIHNASTANGFDAVSVFTNDDLSAKVLERLQTAGVRYIAIRATGYDHVNLECAAQAGIKVANVPAYSPYSVAEHTVALMLNLNRKLIQTDKQVKQYDFTLNNLIGFDMHGKTVGIIGMGRIGSVVAKILKGFGCSVVAYDPKPDTKYSLEYDVKYCTLEELYRVSDIITLNCPLTTHTRYIINANSISQMKNGVMIINCGRGGLLKTQDAIDGLKSGKIGYLGLDVYENEKGLFFFDHSGETLNDVYLPELMKYKNVIITPHQAFLTSTALKNIADTTFENINSWGTVNSSPNELRYECKNETAKQ